MSELEVLRMLRSQGVVSASEFVQLASELHAKQDAEFEEVRSELASLRASPLASVQASPTRASSSSAANRRAHVSDDEDSEMLVDEEGGQYQPPSSPLLSSSTTRSSGCGDAAASSQRSQSSVLSMQSNSAESNKPNPFVKGELLIHAAPPGNMESLGKVTFIRYGLPSDFVNADRAMIEYHRLKKNAKRKVELHSRWVLPCQLQKLEPEGRASSPRADDGTSKAASVATNTAATTSAASSSTEARCLPQEVAAALDKLGEMPELAAHERKRKLKVKPAAGSRRKHGVRQTQETKVPLHDRVTQFQGHSLVVEHGVLFCKACKFSPPNKSQSIKTHIFSPAHTAKLELWLRRRANDSKLAETLVDWAKEHPDLCGTSHVTADQLVFRYQVMEVIMASGTPPERISFFRNLLERSGISLGGVSNLKMFIPQIEKNEIKKLIGELSDEFVSTQFDGTTRLGEAINVINRWCTAEFELRQRLTLFQTVLKHLNAPRLSALIASHLLRELQVSMPNRFLYAPYVYVCAMMNHQSAGHEPRSNNHAYDMIRTSNEEQLGCLMLMVLSHRTDFCRVPRWIHAGLRLHEWRSCSQACTGALLFREYALLLSHTLPRRGAFRICAARRIPQAVDWPNL